MQATNHPTSDRATRTIHPTIAPQPVCAATSSDIAEASTPKSFARKSATTTQPPKIVLIIGSSGQLGHDLCRHLHGQATVIGACRQPEKGSLLPVPVRVDISRPASLRQAIRQVKPTLIVNAAGLTNVDLAEANPRLAQLVNATAPAIMADEAKRLGAGIIHFCSSMVFPGHGERPWREADNPDPCNQYGRTKLLGTEAILASSAPHMVFRTGWLYSSHGDNYVRRLIDLLTYRSSLPMASDHYGTPTSTDWLARTIAGLLATADAPWCDWMAEHGGLLHAAPLGYASRIETGDQILAICRQLGLPIVLKHLQPCPLRELDAQAPIPENCRLDVSRLAMRFSLDLPRWQQELNEQVVKMLGAQNLSLRGIA
jgi:dTDP-4-dehydrorhamnose reductase